MDYQEQLWYLLDLVIAAILGGLIGFERESKNKPAGLRTNMLIAASAATIVIIGSLITNNYAQKIEGSTLATDPIRVIQAIVIGVSFIGAGTIIKSKDDQKVRFLTTSATILFSACAGIVVAMHLYIFGVGIALIALIINYLIKKAEHLRRQ